MEPTLFRMMCSAMLTEDFQEREASFPIGYRFDGKLFNLKRLQAKPKVQSDLLDKFLYAEKKIQGLLWNLFHKHVATMTFKAEQKLR